MSATISSLTPYLQKWERRWRLQKILTWLPRGLALCLIIATMAAFGSALARGNVLLVGLATFAVAALAITVFVGWHLLRPVEQAARYYDHAWHLQERLATTLELESGRIPSSSLSQYQIDDTLALASAIDTRKQLPFAPRWNEWLLPVLASVLFLLVVLVVPNILPSQTALPTQTVQSIEDAAEALRDITALVAEDTALDSAERDALLTTLETRLNELQQTPLSVEQAFASLNEAQSALADAAAQMREAADNQAQALGDAASALNSQSSDAAQQSAEDIANTLQERLDAREGQPSDALADQQLAQEMQRAAEMLQQEFPELSESLQQASESLQNQDDNSQQSLENAQRQAESASQQQQQNQQSAEQLEQSAQTMSESAQDVSEADQQTSQSQNQEGQQQQSQQQEGQQQQQSQQESQESQPSDSQSEQQSSQEQQSPSDQQEGSSAQEQNQGQQSESQSAQSSQQGQSDPQSQGSQPSEQGQQNAQSQESGAQGDTNQEGTTQESDPQGESTGSRESSENVDGQGERDFDSIYAPNPPDTPLGEENAVLQGDASQSPVRPGDNLNLPEQQANVPYNQVYEQYAEQAGRALEGDYVPLGLKDVVREYFNALAP